MISKSSIKITESFGAKMILNISFTMVIGKLAPKEPSTILNFGAKKFFSSIKTQFLCFFQKNCLKISKFTFRFRSKTNSTKNIMTSIVPTLATHTLRAMADCPETVSGVAE